MTTSPTIQQPSENLTQSPITTHQSPALEKAPAWFQDLQNMAWEKYQETPAPTRKNETWRFGDLKQLNLDNFIPASGIDFDELELELNGLEETAAQFIFINDQCVSSSLDESGEASTQSPITNHKSQIPTGVICLPLEDALQEHSELIHQHLLKQEVKLGSEKYAALHAANLSNGLFVYVPKGIEVEKPIEAYHIVAGENAAIFPHTLIITEDNAKVSVVDYFISAPQKSGKASTQSPITNHQSQIGESSETHLVLAMNDLVATNGSQLSYLAIQNVNLSSKVIQIGSTTVDRDARAKSFVLNVGAAWARNESYSTLAGKGAHSDMLSLNIPTADQKYDQRTFQHHASPYTYSDLLYKNALYGKSKTTFSGLITVDEGAHFTDAYQTCRNLLMEDTTETNSMPGLQINADQVKCSHGSTASAISDEEIYYLQARGIHPKQARQLIARGFCIAVIERLENEQLQNLVLNYLDEKFKTVS
ncbi:MAG: Fe-S cluster assembly protein SufD [Rubritalea sp.]